MTECTAGTWRWASESVRGQFNARARSMGFFRPFPHDTRRRYREQVLAAIEEITRFPDAAPATRIEQLRAKTIASTGTARGDVIVYAHEAGVVVVHGVFAYLPDGFFSG